MVNPMQFMAYGLYGHGQAPDTVVGIGVETRVLGTTGLVVLRLVLGYVLGERGLRGVGVMG